MATMINPPRPGLIPEKPSPEYMDDVNAQMSMLGKAPLDYANIVEYNNRASAIAAAIDRDFQQSSAREAMAFEAEQAQLNRDFQQSSAREAMSFDADQAKINREWQEMMSNTAYQRATDDMKKAGLNPILAYTQGGAATTSGATASGHSASGSTARGISSSGSRASVDMNTTADILKQVISSATSVGNNVLNLGEQFIRSAGSMVMKFAK